MNSRRSFIKKSVAAGSAMMVVPSYIPAKVFGANERVNAAVLVVLTDTILLKHIWEKIANLACPEKMEEIPSLRWIAE
jgi:hypothetical protein